jgi:hypothetical protein
MSNSSKLSSAEARAKYAKWLRNRKVRSSGIGILAEGVLPVPVIPDFWPEEPDFAGYVPREQQDQDMAVEIPAWPNGAPDGSEEDTLTIEWKLEPNINWNTIYTYKIPGPVIVGGPTANATIAKNHFSVEGTYSLRYRVLTWNNQNDSSVTQTIIIDKKAPHHGGQQPDLLTFKDASVLTDGITEAYLAANNDTVTVVVPAYNDQQIPGDIVELFIAGENPDPVAGPVFSGAFDATLREADIPGARIRNLPDGHLFVEYHLIDKVGNIGNHSNPLNAELFVKPLPVTPLPVPEVPLAEDTETLIDFEDAVSGVQVLIARYQHWQDIDNIEVNWGGLQFTAPVGTAPEDPIVLPVPWSTVLKPAYGAGPGAVPTAVSYNVMRGSKRFPSDILNINVDLSLPGPPNPGPDPVNPALVAVTVRGGGANAADNELNVDDVGLPATATVVIYDPFAKGERMNLYWGSVPTPVAVYDPDPANDTAGDTITFTIPWTEIAKEPGITDLPVFYSLSFIAGGNTQRSPAQLVDVTGALPITFAPPEFPDAATSSGGRPILNCGSFIGNDHHVRVQIPGNPGLLVGGESVVTEWQAYDDFSGNNQVGTVWTETRTITADEAQDGFELLVEPYDDHIEPVGPYGSVRVTYTATVAGGPVSGTTLIWASSTSAGGACYPTP